jgi:rubrerythrin
MCVEVAMRQSKPRTASLFRAAAQAEEIHARSVFNMLLKSPSLEECLNEAIADETYVYQTMYPSFTEMFFFFFVVTKYL